MTIGVISYPLAVGREWRDLIASVLPYLALLLGLTFAAVLSIGLQRDCHVEQVLLGVDEGTPFLIQAGGPLLATGEVETQCELSWVLPSP
jgi:hypothetical protein